MEPLSARVCTEKCEKGLHFADNACSGSSDEVYDISYLCTVGHLLVYLQYGVKHAGLSVKHQAVCIRNVLLHLVAHTVGGKNGAVNAPIGNG